MREWTGSGGPRGLQILLPGAKTIRGGFDSHTFPPLMFFKSEFFPYDRSEQSFRPEIVEAPIEPRIVNLYLHRILDDHPQSGIGKSMVFQ